MRTRDRRWPRIVARLRGNRVLDFGCGKGALTGGFAWDGCDVVGLDIRYDLLDQAQELAGDTPVEFTHCIRLPLAERTTGRRGALLDSRDFA